MSARRYRRSKYSVHAHRVRSQWSARNGGIRLRTLDVENTLMECTCNCPQDDLTPENNPWNEVREREPESFPAVGEVVCFGDDGEPDYWVRIVSWTDCPVHGLTPMGEPCDPPADVAA